LDYDTPTSVSDRSCSLDLSTKVFSFFAVSKIQISQEIYSISVRKCTELAMVSSHQKSSLSGLLYRRGIALYLAGKERKEGRRLPHTPQQCLLFVL
jgi:hypothetical protein